MRILIKTALAIVIGCLVFSACKKKKENPVGALGANFPFALNKIVTPAILDSLKKHGQTINDGLTPPAVAGTYLLSPNYCTFDDSGDDDTGTLFDDYKYRFSSQDNTGFTIKVEYEDVEGGDSGSDGSATYLSGSGNLFTIFAQTTGTSSNINYTTLQVLSGEKQSNGIKNLQLSTYLVSKGSDPNGDLEPVNSIRLFADQDEISETQTSFAVNQKVIQSLGSNTPLAFKSLLNNKKK